MTELVLSEAGVRLYRVTLEGPSGVVAERYRLTRPDSPEERLLGSEAEARQAFAAWVALQS